MSEDERAGPDSGTERETMADVSHTHPHTGETFGAAYRRGPAAADGGRPSRDATEETMKDVDHTPPHGEGANDVWARGGARSADPGSESDSDEASVTTDDDRAAASEVTDE